MKKLYYNRRNMVGKIIPEFHSKNQLYHSEMPENTGIEGRECI